MVESPYLLIYFGMVILSFIIVFNIVKARRRNEPAYYGIIGACFLLVIAFVSVLFYQIFLFFTLIGLAAIISILLLPQIREINRKEFVKQKQETDVSAPLRLRDFLSFKCWIKLKATYGFFTSITLYIITNTVIIVAVMLAFIVLGLFTTLMAVFYTVTFSVIYFILSYRQVWKILKES